MLNNDLWMRDKSLFELMKSPDCLFKAIQELRADSIPEKRQKLHWSAKFHMLQCDYGKAVSILTSAESELGRHVGASADLATCYYLLGAADQLDQTLKKIGADIDFVLPKLQISNRIRTITLIGKLFEEACQFENALKLYQAGFDLIENEIKSPAWLGFYQPLYRRLLAQTLRFFSQYHFSEKMHASLGLLARLKETQGPPFYSEEIAHAILLATLQQADDFTFEKLELFISEQREPISDFMQNLFFYEFVEFSLIAQANYKLSEDLFLRFKPTNLYDQILRDITLNNESVCLAALENIRQNLPTASILRSFLLVKKCLNTPLSITQNSYMNSLLKSLPEHDQAILSRWIQGKKSRRPTLKLRNFIAYLDTGVLTQSWDLSRKPLIYRMLLKFASRGEFHWIDVANDLWPESDPVLNYDRLRMLLLRVNGMFKQSRKLFELKSEHVICHAKVEKEAA